MKETIIKGYKALSKDMKAIFGNKMQYELNVWYKMEGEIIPCIRGYHFFDNIRDIFILFCNKEYDIYEIEAKGNIIKDDDNYQGKYVCSEIKLVKRLTQEEINKYIEDNLDMLINDEDYEVRREVARQGYGLDILVNDESRGVRCEVVRQGYGLDILVNDEDWRVRYEVARERYGLDILVNDKIYTVRQEVARQGYGLDRLINDEDVDVRYVALETLVKQNEELLGVKLIRED